LVIRARANKARIGNRTDSKPGAPIIFQDITASYRTTAAASGAPKGITAILNTLFVTRKTSDVITCSNLKKRTTLSDNFLDVRSYRNSFVSLHHYSFAWDISFVAQCDANCSAVWGEDE